MDGMLVEYLKSKMFTHLNIFIYRNLDTQFNLFIDMAFQINIISIFNQLFQFKKNIIKYLFKKTQLDLKLET